MIELLETLQFWQWWALAGALVVVETLLPSGILYGVGFAAFLVGLAMAGNVDLAATWQAQIGGFVGLSIVFGWIARLLHNRMLAPQAVPPLNLKKAKPPPDSPSEADFVGAIYTALSPIIGGTGSIKIKGTDYALVGPDLPVGSRIKVIAMKNQILKVEPTD
jgi:membrane protein implicated in regulation of membrane protease activity